MISAVTPGAPNWVDLSTPDVEDALQFYTALFGWTTERSSSPMGQHITANVGQQPVGGMMASNEDMAGMPAMWTVFLHVADIHATVRAIEETGGSILEPPFPIPDGTMIAVVADPTGAMFALSDGLAADGAWYSHEPGAATWVELLTTDLAAAEAFYASVFNWKGIAEATAGAGEDPYTMFLLDEEEVAGMLAMPDGIPTGTPPHWSIYFATNDCEKSVARAVTLGGSVLVPTTDIAGGRFAVLADRQGATFNLLEHNR